MHYAISHDYRDFQYLTMTPRKKSIKHMLLKVEQGLTLLKLGKTEYAIEAGQAVWIPFDALCALTFFPQTQVQQIEVSSRVTSFLPKQGGFVTLNELTNALLNRLKVMEDRHDAKKNLLTVLQEELSSFKPQLKESELTQQINQWAPNIDSKLLVEQQLVLNVREAYKRMQSGQSRHQVVAELFEGNEAMYSQIEKTIRGEKQKT
ncbi:AraC family transcriptional regulator [Vibrio sp. Isolate24]|uniref:AraC family transcriptional regulator n=1 Tax=Vibrio sp. Isolate24 TaxID=2908534 RepID=UPI001EFD9411|nr:AraC family transcriptional regulator [Vibrio sp. Isolate24]MCG9677477.1 AraC family transcriptional regulator [Vibrio sp. Isolate24]